MENQQNNQLQSIDAEPSTSPPPAPMEPSLSSESAPSTPEVPVSSAPKNKKKRLIAGLIVAAVVALLVTVGVLAYNLWYQNPEKVITDGVVNAIKSKSVAYTGSATMTGGQEAKIEVTGKSKGATGDLSAKVTFKVEENKNITVEGNALVDAKGDLYFKVSNADAVAKEYRDQQTPEFQELIDNVISKVNNQWIKVSANDLKTFSESTAKNQECMNDAMAKIRNDEATTSEITETYKKHKFVVVDKKLGSRDGSLGYQLSVDQAVTKAFVADFKNTAIYKSLQACDSSFTLDEKDLFKESDTSKSTTQVEVWVSRWSHQITKLNIESTQDNDKVVVVFEPTFNASVDEVTAPAQSITLTQLQADIQALFEAAMPTSADIDSPMYAEDAI